LKSEIKDLEAEYKRLKSTVFDNIEDSKNENCHDLEELGLLKEEQDLIDEMNLIGEKYRTVNIVYDKVYSNMKKILERYELKKTKDSREETSSENKEENDLKDGIITEFERILNENLVKIRSFLKENSNKEQFEALVRDKFKVVSGKVKVENKLTKEISSGLIKPKQFVEYDYDDQQVKLEDKKIEEEQRDMIKAYFLAEKRAKELEEKEANRGKK